MACLWSSSLIWVGREVLLGAGNSPSRGSIESILPGAPTCWITPAWALCIQQPLPSTAILVNATLLWWAVCCSGPQLHWSHRSLFLPEECDPLLLPPSKFLIQLFCIYVFLPCSLLFFLGIQSLFFVLFYCSYTLSRFVQWPFLHFPTFYHILKYIVQFSQSLSAEGVL